MTDSINLPDPDSSPASDVVIWDGQCNFCHAQVQRLRRLDVSGNLAYISLHDPRVAERYPELSPQQLMDEMWVVTANGRRFGGADAGRYLSRKLPALWWLAPLLHLPLTMPCWRWIYRRIAQRRYHISGTACDDEGTCHLHSKP